METTEKTLLTQSPEIVTYSVKVNNVEIEKKHQLVSITIETGINKVPFANIIINDGEASIEDFAIDSSGVFEPGNKIEIQLGYQNDKKGNVTVFKGLIKKNNHKINNHCSELNIECKHEADIMTLTSNSSCAPQNSNIGDIIKNILKANHLDDSCVAHTKATLQQAMQLNVSDWDFIMGTIDKAGMLCTFPKSVITIKNPPSTSSSVDSNKNDSAPGKTDAVPADGDPILAYGHNILEFDADNDPRVESTMIQVSTWDYRKQAISKVENDEDLSNVKDSQLYNFITINAPTSLPPDEAQLMANSKALLQRLSKIKGTVIYQGSTEIEVGTFARLKGLGKGFEGRAFISNIIHEYADGCWKTTAALGMDGKFYTEQTNPSHSASSSGQPSSIQGLHIGKVTNIEDKDGDYRVKVKLPMVDNTGEGLYARVATLDAGNKRGTFFRPELDDEVVLGFMNDDPSNPVILGMLHSTALPSPIEPEKKNNKKGYVSRSAIKLLFDDEAKSVRIETPGKRIVELNDQAGTITLQDDNHNVITMDKNGISIKSGADMNFEAKGKISMKAGSEFAAKANAAVNIEGKGPVTVKSSANTVIKGTVVMIN